MSKRLRVLHLTLHRKWFDEIRSGEKKEEYRDETPYWDSRLENKDYDLIRFVNGYGKNRPFMIVEFKGSFCVGGCWSIRLGKILEVGNLPPQAGEE